MTDIEMREQAKEIVYQSLEAQKRAEALKIKASDTGEALIRIGEALRKDATLLLDQKWKHDTDETIVANVNSYSDTELERISYLAAIQLAREVQAAQEKCGELTAKKRRLRIDL